MKYGKVKNGAHNRQTTSVGVAGVYPSLVQTTPRGVASEALGTCVYLSFHLPFVTVPACFEDTTRNDVERDPRTAILPRKTRVRARTDGLQEKGITQP